MNVPLIFHKGETMTEMTSVGTDREITETEKRLELVESLDTWLDIMQLERDS